MVKKKNAITLLALVITIVIILLLAGIAIQMTMSENGLMAKATKTKRDNAKAELFDVATLKFSNMSIDDAVDKTDTLNFATLYNSNEFRNRYEIKNEIIHNKISNEEVITKEEFEENFRDIFRKIGRETQKPLVNPINSASTELTGIGERGAEIIVTVGGVEKKTVVDNDGNWKVVVGTQPVGTEIKIIQKAGGKVESTDTTVKVQKEKLPKVTVNQVYNTSTTVEGSGVVGATIKVIDNHGTERTGIVATTGKFSVAIPTIAEDTIISVLQTMNDKEDSDIETVVVQKGKGSQPTVNPVDNDDTAIGGRGVIGATIVVRIDGAGEYRTTVNGSGNWAVAIPVQQQGRTIRVSQEQARRTPSDEVVISVVRAPEPLPQPQVNPLYNDHYQIAGRGEPGATIVARVDGVGDLRTTVDGASNWRIETQVFLTMAEGREVHVRQEKAGRPNSPETHLAVRKGMSRIPEVTGQSNSNSHRWVQEGAVNRKVRYDYFMITGKGIPGSRILLRIISQEGKNVWPQNVEHTVYVDGAGNWKFYVEYNGNTGWVNKVEIKQVENNKHYSVPKYVDIRFQPVRDTWEDSIVRVG